MQQQHGSHNVSLAPQHFKKNESKVELGRASVSNLSMSENSSGV